jgi:UDP-N-acetylmuramate dehydrogenase
MMALASNDDLRGDLSRDVSLKSLTSWRVGGNAQRFYRPADLDDLCHFLSTLPPAEPLLWLGLGSNLLIRDGGVQGTVIAVHGALNRLERIEGAQIRAEAGVPCAKVARYSAKLGLGECEFLAGIPGTMGGALAMNAGAFGGETWHRVVKVLTVDRFGELRHRLPEEYKVAYRSVIGPAKEWFAAAYLQLQAGSAEVSLRKIRALLSQRSDRQPMGMPSCGSVFRNPEGDYAARLIEAAGLKGHIIGGARVSDKHANFIVNTGAANAVDIEALIDHIRCRVEQVHGIRLIPEVQILGEPA